MKIMVITDSHGQLNNIYLEIEKEKPDAIIWTGDCIDDATECSFVFQNIDFYIVRGNCDILDNKYREFEILNIEGIKILITHGHLFGVKNDMNQLKLFAEKHNVQLVCFGHTHIPYINEMNKIKYFNPGALKDAKYGIILIENKNITLKNKEIVQSNLVLGGVNER